MKPFLILIIFSAYGIVSHSQTMSKQLGQDPVLINPKAINLLFSCDAMQTSGITQYGPESQLKAKRFWLNLKSGQKIAWNINVPTVGSYYIDFLLSASAGTKIQVSGPGNSVIYSLSTNGWQRATAGNLLQLPAGNSTLSLQLADDNKSMDIKSIELINQAERSAIYQRAQAFKGDASWMKDAGYGIMTQVGGWSYPSKGNKKAWPGFAEDFDEKTFVSKVCDMGAKYIVWSVTWSDYLFPAPIQAIAEVLPNRVSKRDLIGDLIKECKKYGLRVMIYYHMGHDHKDVLLAKGWINASVQTYRARQVWLDREMKIFKEVGNRYGKDLDAIFLDDGCVWYPADFEKLGAALKAGNPKRLICYNPWVAASFTPFQDFYCGENFNGKTTPYKLDNSGLVAEGPQKGLQLFGNFIFDGPDWGINKANTVISSPNGWTSDQIVSIAQKLQKEQYSVAFNLLAYEDGTLGTASYTMLKSAAAKLKRTCTITVTDLQEEISIKGANCYPNPFSKEFQIRANGYFEYFICDLMGKKVEEGKGVENVFAGHELMPGTYILQVKNQHNSRTYKLRKD